MIHIGICDDEKGMQKQIYDIVQHELFKYDDAEYTYYSSGKEVIEAIEADDFYCDLLLLDINMPKTDGLSTASRGYWNIKFRLSYLPAAQWSRCQKSSLSA